MRIWEHSIEQAASRLDCEQFRFLTVPRRIPYLTILIGLYRAREEDMQFEVPFESLYERTAADLEKYKTDGHLEPLHLREDLKYLESYGNVAMRLEPKRIRRIQDRGLERYLVRLTESTSAILSQLEAQLEKLDQETGASARFNLLEVEDALSAAIAVLESQIHIVHDEFCRVGFSLARAKRAVEDAGEELLRLDLWLSEAALQVPDRDRLGELLAQIENYFERYLQDVDERRQRCHEKLLRLRDQHAEHFLDRVGESLEREFADDPTRVGRRPPDPHRMLLTVQEFLEPDGILDRRRMDVHERLADVAGHLKRYLAELVRRSQVVAGLRKLSHRLLSAEDSSDVRKDIEQIFLDLWQPGHVVLDQSDGTPREQVEPQRPHRYYTRTSSRFAGASIRPSQNGRAKSGRPMLVEEMEKLNEFVHRIILRGAPEALVSEAELEDLEQIRLLISAVRTARLDKSRLRRRYLHYQVILPTEPTRVTLTPNAELGRLHLPQLIFQTTLESRRTQGSRNDDGR